MVGAFYASGAAYTAPVSFGSRERAISIDEHLDTFAGLPVEPFDPDRGIRRSPAEVAYQVAGNLEEGSFFDALEAFVADPRAGEVTALVIGAWLDEDAQSSAAVIE